MPCKYFDVGTCRVGELWNSNGDQHPHPPSSSSDGLAIVIYASAPANNNGSDADLGAKLVHLETIGIGLAASGEAADVDLHLFGDSAWINLVRPSAPSHTATPHAAPNATTAAAREEANQPDAWQ